MRNCRPGLLPSLLRHRLHFIGVGAPQLQSGYGADLSQVEAAVDGVLPYLGEHPDVPTLVVGKSTVPVGTLRAPGSGRSSAAGRQADSDLSLE